MVINFQEIRFVIFRFLFVEKKQTPRLTKPIYRTRLVLNVQKFDNEGGARASL